MLRNNENPYGRQGDLFQQPPLEDPFLARKKELAKIHNTFPEKIRIAADGSYTINGDTPEVWQMKEALYSGNDNSEQFDSRRYQN